MYKNSTGGRQISESRLDAAISRLETAAIAVLKDRNQGSFDMGDDQAMAGLQAENAALREELQAMTDKYEALERKTDIVCGRLDKSINDITAILEQ
jgi:seryl-tRNA synthetase